MKFDEILFNDMLKDCVVVKDRSEVDAERICVLPIDTDSYIAANSLSSIASLKVGIETKLGQFFSAFVAAKKTNVYVGSRVDTDKARLLYILLNGSVPGFYTADKFEANVKLAGVQNLHCLFARVTDIPVPSSQRKVRAANKGAVKDIVTTAGVVAAATMLGV